MRIAYLSTFYPFRGGISQFNGELFKALQTENTLKAYNFTTLYPGLFFPGSSQFVSPGDVASRISSERILSSINPLTYFHTANEIKKLAPDLLIMGYWMPFFGPSMGTVARLLKKRCKIISILNNVIPHEHRIGDKILNHYFLKQNHGFVVMSDTVKKDLLYYIPDAQYIYYPHPIYSHFGNSADRALSRKKLTLPDNKKIVLFFGFIRDYKGLDLLIEAISKLNDEYVLVVAGEAYGSFDKYDRQIADLGVGNKIIKHIRYISDDEVPAFFSAADVCVLPYKSATQSGITAVAYHFNLPLIATNTGGLSETIQHNKTGLIVELPDPNLIASAIESYFLQNLKESFQREIQFLKKRLSWEGMANAIIQFSKTL